MGDEPMSCVSHEQTETKEAMITTILSSSAARAVRATVPRIAKATIAVSIARRSSNNIRSFGSTSKVESSDRPFQILGLQQIAVGSLSKESMTNIWVDVLGIEKVGDYQSEKENVDEVILTVGERDGPHRVEVDLMTPLDPEKSPKVHSPALNHIGLWVDDLPSAVSWMKEKGVRFTPGGIRKGASGYDVTFIHPKGSDDAPIGGAGVLIELVQAPQDVKGALKK